LRRRAAGSVPIAEPLHVSAAVARDGLLQHVAVRRQDALRLLIAYPVQ